MILGSNPEGEPLFLLLENLISFKVQYPTSINTDMPTNNINCQSIFKIRNNKLLFFNSWSETLCFKFYACSTNLTRFFSPNPIERAANIALIQVFATTFAEVGLLIVSYHIVWLCDKSNEDQFFIHQIPVFAKMSLSIVSPPVLFLLKLILI